jgi:ABC-type bacteriocin/lantibiotic exporter with double-glycine peptidase domain
MLPTDAPSSNPGRELPPSATVAEATLRMLTELAESSPRPLVMAEALAAMERLGAEEPMAQLAAGAATLGLRLVHRRLAAADAVWLAEDAMPVLGWSERNREWLSVRRHGFLRPVVWRSGSPEGDGEPMSRGDLVRLLGASSAAEPVDFALVLPERPAEAMHDMHAHAEHGEGMTPIRRLLALMKPEAPEFWAITVFSAITGLLALALPLAVNGFISNLSFGTRSGPFLQALVAIALVLFLCLAAAAVLRAIQHVAAEVIQRRIFVRLVADLAHRLPSVDIGRLDGVHVPELVNRFLEVVTLQKAAALIMLTGINLVLSAAIGLTVLAFYHPFLLGLAVLLLMAIAGIVFLAGRGAVPTSIEESRRKYEVVAWLEELARHPRLFKGPGGTDLAVARADDLARGYLESRRRHFRVLLRQISGLLALEVAAGTVLLGVGGWLVLNQQLTLGQLVASEIIVSAIVAAIAKLGKQFEAWYDAVAGVDKLGYLVDLQVERQGGDTVQGSGGMAVEVHDLALDYPGQPASLGDLSLHLDPGERVALLASLGSGTSMLLEIMLGYRTPADGTVEVAGLDVRNWNLASLREQAVLLREGDLFAGTIADNLRMGLPGVTLARLQAAIDRVGLGPVIATLPQGLQTQLVPGGLPLTSRQRLRLLVARAVVMRPRLLLVDEMLDGLDEATTDTLCGVLSDAGTDWTVLLATRDPRVAARMNRVIDADAVRRAAGHD